MTLDASTLRKLRELCDGESVLEIIREWKWAWMNQKQNSEEDYQNYYRRAVGIDANMIHSLAKRLCEARSALPLLLDAYEKLQAENAELRKIFSGSNVQQLIAEITRLRKQLDKCKEQRDAYIGLYSDTTKEQDLRQRDDNAELEAIK